MIPAITAIVAMRPKRAVKINAEKKSGVHCGQMNY